MDQTQAVFRKVGATHLVRLRGSQTGVHVNPMPCILFGRDRSVTVKTVSGVTAADAVLVDACSPHIVDFGGGAVDVLYLEGAAAHAVQTQRLDRQARRLLEDEIDHWSQETAAALFDLLALSSTPPDPQILELVREIDADPMARLSEIGAAHLTGLERTSMLRRFKRHTGMTFRGYKNWAALKLAGNLFIAGEKIGLAGLDAGFADAPHFSRRFKGAFGLSPSQARDAVA
jgi:AraC-like DNA-binding protein